MKNREKIHGVVYGLAHRVAPLLLRGYRYRTQLAPEMDEPYIVLANHTTELDMAMLITAFPRHMYFVCGEHLMRTKFASLLRFFFDPIPAPRGGGMMKTLKNILERTKRGHNVMMFPEGCRSFHGETLPVAVSTGKIVKKTGHALITYRTRGGYFIAPRWAYKTRPGPAWGEVVNVYSSQQLAQMSAQEVTDAINRDIFENAYDTQRADPLPYRGKGGLAEGLENYLVICPKCGSYDTMHTQGDRFRCTECGLSGEYDPYGTLVGEKLPFDRVDTWGKWMEERFEQDVKGWSPDKLLFTHTNVQFYEITPDHRRIDLERGEVRIYRDRMEFGLEQFAWKDISALSLLYFGKTVLFTHKGRYLGLTGDGFHAWKIEQLYQKQDQLAPVPAAEG